VEVKYTTLPGWNKSTYGTKTWFDLPVNARKYVEYIEEFVGVKVKYIGTGPGREHMIYRDALPV
jgi:adenylosuccinate synthase